MSERFLSPADFKRITTIYLQAQKKKKSTRVGSDFLFDRASLPVHRRSNNRNRAARILLWKRYLTKKQRSSMDRFCDWTRGCGDVISQSSSGLRHCKQTLTTDFLRRTLLSLELESLNYLLFRVTAHQPSNSFKNPIKQHWRLPFLGDEAWDWVRVRVQYMLRANQANLSKPHSSTGNMVGGQFVE